MRKKIAQFRKQDWPICKFYEPYHPMLRTRAEYTKLSFNKSSFSHLQKMKKTATLYKFAYLASNQVYSKQNMFVINKNFKDYRWIDESYTDPKTYKGYINPQIQEFSSDKIEVWERCMSFPYIECKVKRSSSLKVQYVNQKRENINQQLFGFKAVLFQHCMEHLKGKCAMDWDVCYGSMRIYSEGEDLFPKTRLVLRDYSFKIQQFLSKRKSSNQNEEFLMSEEQKEYQKKQEEVVRKYFQDELNLVTERYGK